MRKIDHPLTIEGKGSKNKNPRRGKSFGYQVLGFGSGGLPSLKYVEATGGTITTDGDYTVHTFNADGNFCVTAIGDSCTPATYRDQVTWLVNAGGGAGGGRVGGSGGGGGAGGFRDSPSASGGCYAASPLAANSAVTVAVATYPVTVGAGAIGVEGYNNGAAGSPSSFSTYNTSGGGGGGYQGGGGAGTSGTPGGSGGGGGAATTHYGGGSGNSGGYTPPEGNPGSGSSPHLYPWGRYAGGGGGATSTGSYSPPLASRGGDGAISLIDGTSVEYSAGYHGGPDHGPGGGGYSAYGDGGDGAVIIRYRSSGRP